MSPILPFLLALGLFFAAKTIGLTLGPNSKLCAVTAASTITNSGFTVLTGCLCLSPGSAHTGFPPGTASCFEVGSPLAIGSEAEAATTFGDCAALTFTQELSGVPLGGLTLGPGVYKFATAAALNGNVILDAAGDPNVQFIFQVGTALGTGVSSKVLLINGAKACNVYWCVGSSATIAATTEFKGVVIAYAGITVGTSATDVGGLYALNAAITLLTNAVVKSGEC